MNPLNLFILGGCGASTPFLNHLDKMFQSSIVVETGDALYVMDAGDPANTLMLDRGFTKPVKGIFITHMDGDHVDGLMPLLVRVCRSNPCMVALPLPEEDIARVEAAWEVLHGMLKPVHRPHFVALREGFTFDDGDFHLDVLPTRHCQIHSRMPNRRNPSFDSLAFAMRVRYHGLRIVYSGDYEEISELDKWLQEGVDAAILEHAHTVRTDLYAREIASYPELPFICFTHVWSGWGSREYILNEMKRTLPETTEVVLSTPGMELRFEDAQAGAAPCVVPYEEAMRRPAVYPPIFDDAATLKMCAERGIPAEWFYLGPFENKPVNGVYHGLEHDNGVGMRPDFNRFYEGLEGERITWRPLPLRVVGENGRIDFKPIMDGDDRLVYVFTTLNIEKDGNYCIFFGSDDGIRMWLDGSEIFLLNITRGAEPDQHQLDVNLKAGSHDLMIAVDQHWGGWMFYWRITDAKTGAPAVGRS